MNGLGVNIDHVATLRQARRADEPDPIWAAAQAELGGADGITFHLREDRRHINDRDAELLKRTVATKLNMELSAAPEIVKLALELKPTQCTLVPERREELTTEGGLAVARLAKQLRPVVERLKEAGIIVSAFIEPEAAEVRACKECGFDAIELWTGGYAHAKGPKQQDAALERLVKAADVGYGAGLSVHAGHGLTYRNIAAIARLCVFEEFNIGHSIVSRALFVGMREAVAEMKRLIDRAVLEAGVLAAEPDE